METDYEISSVRNELRKKDDELVEARKQRESASYRVSLVEHGTLSRSG
jgi:hypothetical protein